jgi:glucose uptake protein
MFIVNSYSWAVILCVVTMLCWGSWANTQKLSTKKWSFQLFYWDYTLGVLILALLLAFTLGSFGENGRSFLLDIVQADLSSLVLALIGGLVFNLANILLVIAIDIAGMAVAFPVGIGLALVIGVITNYIGNPVGNAFILFLGVAFVTAAIILDALAYRKVPAQGNKTTTKGIIISIAAGVLMGFFYRFVAASMAVDFLSPEPGKITPYTASVIFAIGLLLSNFIWNTIAMYKPVVGDKVTYGDYFKKGELKLHSIGILGGAIWGLGMTFNIIASGQAGFAISYGLGQGATLVAALWGVFIWREFKGVKGVIGLITLMFLLFLIGIACIIAARIF